ncbi:uncharacterized protein LOC108923700 isoform X2 [Scleropages formosus]|uniref:uncharacterized protein LOC108923700 isoform X2 n=1 Tax=Scleropages formosus TaxID=113540 RepID=UPI0010FA70D8|nr:uncharacterized protein LOC108923700 isoform X2 [Scleropages formosus]
MPSNKSRKSRESLGVVCQDCGVSFRQLKLYKQHARSVEHKQRLETLFAAAPPTGPVLLPHIVVRIRAETSGMEEAPLGLHLVTMCYSSGISADPFYLCHSCRERCSNNLIVRHLSSAEHRFSYFASAKPYLLTFGWTPRPDPTAALKPGVVLMKKDTGPLMVTRLGDGGGGRAAVKDVAAPTWLTLSFFQILDVPKKLFESMRKSPYFQIVKDILRQRLPEKLQVEKRPRVTLRDFAEREKRTHPLLGLGFLVEYGDAARTWLCGYLCLLCGRKLHQNEAIAHLLGFEHVFAALNRTLPGSVGHKDLFRQRVSQDSSLLLDLARQAALADSARELQEVKLDPEDFEKVDSLSFENALAKLQAVSGECGESAPRLSGTPAPERALVPGAEVGVEPVTEPKSAPTERVGDGVDRAPAGDEAVAPRSSSESLLDEDEQELRRFIATPHRVEPVVGVGAVLRCCAESRTPVYVCRACCVKMPRSTVVVHLSGCEHRYLYLRWQHPELLRRYKSQNQTQELELMAATLRTAAQELEQLEGCGEVQVLELDAAAYEDMLSKSLPDALDTLQTSWRERYGNQSEAPSLLNPERVLVAVKEEMVECSLCPEEPRQLPEGSEMDYAGVGPHPHPPFSGTNPERKDPSVEATGTPVPEPTCALDKRGGSEIPSQAYRALWNHLKSKLRRQPVVGLRTVVEYHEDGETPYFTCETCSFKVPQGFVVGHLISAEHRYKYIKAQHPRLLNGWKEDPDLTEYEDVLAAKAKFLELAEGLGQIQIMRRGKNGFEPVLLQPTGRVKEEPDVLSPASCTMGESKECVKGECGGSLVAPPADALDPVGAAGSTGTLCVKQTPCPSSKVLWDFLKSPNRTEPVVGLSLMMQVFTEDQPPRYVCEPCQLKMSKGFIISHIIGASHRVAYVKSRHPDLLGTAAAHSSARLKEAKMKAAAKSLELAEGPGEMKILKVDQDAYKAVVSASSREAIKLLRAIWDRQSGSGSAPAPRERREQTDSVTGTPLPGPAAPAKQAAPQTSTPGSRNEDPSADAWPYCAPRAKAPRSIFTSKYSYQKLTTALGLSAVVECQPAKGCPFYVCKPCLTKLVQGEIFNHVNSTRHRLAYIKERHSALLTSQAPSADRFCTQRLLKTEGPGSILVMRLDFEDYRRVHRMAAKEALDELLLIWKKRFQSDRQPGVTPETIQEKETLIPTPQPPIRDVTDKAPAGEPTQTPPEKNPIDPQAVRDPSPSVHVEGLTLNLPVAEYVSPDVPEEPGPKAGSESRRRRATLPPPALDPQTLRRKGEGVDGDGAVTRTACREPPAVRGRIAMSSGAGDALRGLSPPGGAADESHLAKFLLPFLSTREEPVIGLSKVLECRSFKQPTLYLCLCCEEKVDHVNICRHVTGRRHRYCCIKSEHPHLLQSLGNSPDADGQAGLLVKLAEVVECREGRGRAQVLKLDPLLYREVVTAEFQTALEKLDVSRAHTQRGVCVLWRSSAPLSGDVPPEPAGDPQTVEEISAQSPEEPAEGGRGGEGAHWCEGAALCEREDTDAAMGRRDRAPVRGLEEQVAALGEESAVVGLQAVIECRCADAESRPYIYLCQACSLKLEEDSVLEHVCSSLHLYHYISSWRSWVLEAEKKAKKPLFGISELLKAAAARIRRSEGCGRLQVVQLPEGAFGTVAESSYELCMTLVKAGSTSGTLGDPAPSEVEPGAQAAGPSARGPGGSGCDDDPRAVAAPRPAEPHPPKGDSEGSLLSARCSDQIPVASASAGRDLWTAASGGSSISCGNHDNLSLTLAGSRCRAGDGTPSSEVEIVERVSGAHGRTVIPHGVPPEDRQTIRDQILELILRKEMIDKELKLSGDPQGPHGVRAAEMAHSGNRTAEDGPPSVVTTVPLGASEEPQSRSLKRKRLEDDGDPFSYENRQFPQLGPGGPAWGCRPLEWRVQDQRVASKLQSTVQQSSMRTVNIEVETPLGSPWSAVPGHHSTVTAVDAAESSVLTRESRVQVVPGPSAVAPLQYSQSSVSSTKLSKQILRECSGKLWILENYRHSTGGGLRLHGQPEMTGAPQMRAAGDATPLGSVGSVSDRKRPGATSSSSEPRPAKVLVLDSGATEVSSPGGSAVKDTGGQNEKLL